MQPLHLKDKKVLVIGLGISGRSAAGLLLSQGAQVSAVDGNQELLEKNNDVLALQKKGLSTYHEKASLPLQQFDLIVVSPGISPLHPLYHQAQQLAIPLMGEVELACRFLKGSCLGITGTNGKTTVTLLVAHVLKTCGYRAQALGNVGIPLTSECLHMQDESAISVIELSSFQLETMHSQILDAAVILNITPDHLDRYDNMAAYALAKLNIARCLKSSDGFYIEKKCLQEFGNLLPHETPKAYGYDPDCHLYTDLLNIFVGQNQEVSLPIDYQRKASHDLENLMAAYALCRHVGVTSHQFLTALTTFQKPSHRIQFIKKTNGISFYDDSKGTNIDAVIRAVQVVDGKIILIAGGVDKGAAYTPWIAAFADKVRCIHAIGQAAQKIKQDLAHAIPVDVYSNLEDAVKEAAQRAQPGDSVLLSPGCSSFDMFKDYVHRGKEFQKIVQELSL